MAVSVILIVVLFVTDRMLPPHSAFFFRSFRPYRVVGGGGDGIVTTDPILWKWKDAPITVISAFNATLLRTAASMLGMNVDKSDDISGAH